MNARDAEQREHGEYRQYAAAPAPGKVQKQQRANEKDSQTAQDDAPPVVAVGGMPGE
jgi:hypothetical protein